MLAGYNRFIPRRFPGGGGCIYGEPQANTYGLLQLALLLQDLGLPEQSLLVVRLDLEDLGGRVRCRGEAAAGGRGRLDL